MTPRAFGLVLLLAVMLTGRPARAAEPGVELLGVRKIWDATPHNAFTDLIRYKDAWYCVFRESSAHIPGLDGRIRLLRSTDGDVWESAALVAEKGVDLRDPKISLAPDGRLMLLMGGSVYDGAEPTPNRKRLSGRSRVSFSTDAKEWSTPKPVEGIAGDQWLWRVTWHKGVGYGTVYSTAKHGGKRALSVWRTTDGIKYENPIDPKPGIDLTEATVRFTAGDEMIILLRGEEKDRHAWVGRSAPPYEKWDWHDGGHAAQGPDFIVLPDARTFYAGRDFAEKGAAKTVFGRFTPAGALEPLITFPSGGDTSYPALADAGGGVLWVTYYASHEGKAAIYLAKVRVGGDGARP
jgi:hypothetical protein